MGISERMRNKGGDVSRFRQIGLGMLLGFAFGTLMWGIRVGFGAEGGVKVWLYLAITTAMIGAGVAGVFGAMNARKRGERVSPRIMPKDSAEAKAEAKAAKAEAREQAKAEADARKQSH